MLNLVVYVINQFKIGHLCFADWLGIYSIMLCFYYCVINYISNYCVMAFDIGIWKD